MRHFTIRRAVVDLLAAMTLRPAAVTDGIDGPFSEWASGRVLFPGPGSAFR
jgi:hypothetical protein